MSDVKSDVPVIVPGSTTIEIMLSYDYNNFKVGRTFSLALTDAQINEERKKIQRLVDEAIRQYKIQKQMLLKRENAEYEKERHKNRMIAIGNTPIQSRTVKDNEDYLEYQEGIWEKRFNFDYDYKDDEKTPEFSDNLPF